MRPRTWASALAGAAAMSLGTSQLSALPTLSSIELLTATNRTITGSNPPFVPGNLNGSVRTNGVGYSLTGTSTGNISFVYGNPNAATAAGSSLLRFGTDFSPVASFGVYHGLQTDGRVNTSASDRLFFGSNTVGVAGQPLPPGMVATLGLSGSPNYGSFNFQNLGAFGNVPFYRMGWTGASTAPTSGVALVRGEPTSPTKLVATGDLLAGLPTAITTGNAALQIDSTSSSPGGSDWMTRVQINTSTPLGVTTQNNTALVYNGQVLNVGTGIARTREPITLAGARPNELWNRFDRTAVSRSGGWAFNAEGIVLGPPQATFSTLAVVNDQIVARQGDVVNVGGIDVVLTANFGQIAMNDDGDWAMAVGATLLNNSNVVRDLLLVNGKPVVVSNVTLYDLDSVPTAVSDLAKATGRVAITDRDSNNQVTVIFQGFISPTSGNLGYYAAQVLIPEPAALSLLMLGGLSLRRRRS